MPFGEIKSIFFSEFHPKAGPKVVYQVPENYISKEDFDAIHVYVITKPQLRDRIITVDALGHKIVGCPVYIESDKYPRNKLIFNLCFVFESKTNTFKYECVVKKLAGYLTTLESESEFLSRDDTKQQLPDILTEILQKLNESGACLIPIDKSTAIHLKVMDESIAPAQVCDHDVPIFEPRAGSDCSKHDVATQQLLPFVDGFKHVARIAFEANVDINIVKASLQNLLYYGTIKLISLFQYSNVYVTTPDINRLVEDKMLQDECLLYVARLGQCPSFHSVLTLYCGLKAGTTVRDLCARQNPHSYGIDERKMIHFGLMRGLIRHLQKYPVKLPSETGCTRHKTLYCWFNGSHSYDEICLQTGISQQELDEKVESDPSIVICWK